MKNVGLHLFLFFLIFIPVFYFYSSSNGFIETDTYAFYNQTCQNKYDLETPILSKAFFHALPCNELIWKLFNLLLVFCIFSSFYYAIKQFKLPPSFVWIIGLSGFLIGFLFGLEDDMIAYPLIIVSSAWFLQKPNNFLRAISYIGLTLFLGLLVWKGAFIPMGMVFLFTIHPFLSLLPLFFLGIGAGNNWGDSLEAIPGQGFVINNFILFPIILLFFYEWKNRKLLSTFLLLGSFLILTFFQPKWGEYIIIPILPLLYAFYERFYGFWKILPILGIIFLILFSSFILLIKVPTENQWQVIQTAVIYQKKGFPVYNDWGFGHYIESLGGRPTQKGGYHGPQYPSENEYYWLGTPEQGKECIPIIEKDLIGFYKCDQKTIG